MQKLSRSPQGILIPNGAKRTPLKVMNAQRNSFFTIVARARVTVTVAAATAVLNRGSAFALADSVQLDENGTERSICRGKVLRYASEVNAPSALSASRLPPAANGTLPVGVYLLEEAARMNFAFPLSNAPLETAYVEGDVRQSFNLVIQRVADPVASLVTAGPATVVVDNIEFTIIQGFEEPGRGGIKAPLYLPTITEQTLDITGVNAKKVEYIKTTNQIRMLVLSQEVDGVEVGDIINAVGLRGQFREVIGPAMDWDDLLLDSEFDFGGAVVSSNRSHMALNFQRYGQLSETLSPVQDVNLRWELDVKPSARAGTSTVRTTIFELLRDPKVTAPTIPFPV